MKKIIFVVLLITGLLGCANVGTKFNATEIKVASDNSATVYFYRLSKFQAGSFSFSVIANEIKIGALDNGAYFKQTISPGDYKIHSDLSLAENKVATISFEAGKTYFVRCFLDMGVGISSTRFVSIHKDEAIPEIEETGIQL